MEPMLKSKLHRSLSRAALTLIGFSALLWVALQGYAVEWTGFGNSGEEVVQGKTLWDWMNLLLLPLVLAVGALLLNRSGRRTERQQAEEREALEREIARDRQQEASLQAYFDRMSDLLLKEKLSKFSNEELRNVARIQTLTVFRGLDARRKGLVFLFLKDSKLVEREAVIDLCGADMSGASAPYAVLNRVNLSEADLSGCDLHGADLGRSYLGGTLLRGANLSGANLAGADLLEADLSGADLTRASLRGANLQGADLRSCCLNGADLSDADLTGVNLNVGDLVGASLRGARLGGAKLVGADLSQADLSLADLSGTLVTPTELEKVKSLEGATMPDGSKHA